MSDGRYKPGQEIHWQKPWRAGSMRGGVHVLRPLNGSVTTVRGGMSATALAAREVRG